MIAKLLLAGAVAVPAAATATVAATGVALIDVTEGGKDGHRFVVPVPLVLAEVAAGFVPDRELDLHLGAEGRKHLRAASALLTALAGAEDGEYVRVEEAREKVIVEKRGNSLHVSVHGPDEDVEVNLPLSALSAVIGRDGHLSPRQAVRLLGHARFSTLVDVRDGDDHVKITVF